jgi:hypothetical protein
LLQFWKDKILESKHDHTIYLPIDFSDQYTGCLQIHKNYKNLTLGYRSSKRTGWAVDPLNPDDYYQSINDFQAYPN